MKKNIKIIHVAVLAVVTILYFGIKALPSFSESRQMKELESFVYVSRAVDGDTLKLSDGRRVRLIGIDTPEMHYSKKLLKDAKKSRMDTKAVQALGSKAYEFTKSLVEGKKVKLEYDVERYDKYGRTLAYIYLEDGKFVNAEIMKEGYAQIMTIPPNVKYAGYFSELQRSARENNKGLWAENMDGGAKK